MSIDYAQIVEGCRRRDRQAQRQLYDALAPKVLGVCVRYLHDLQEAQDVMQDAFVLVFERIGQLRDPQRLEAWVRKVTVSLCLKHFRRQRLRMDLETVSVEPSEQPFDPFAADEVVNALTKLPPQQRVVFNLVAVEGYDYTEAAKELRCSEVNVRALYSRARHQLRELLTSNNDNNGNQSQQL